jgi:hypothetical protein
MRGLESEEGVIPLSSGGDFMRIIQPWREALHVSKLFSKWRPR